ncbi:MAG: RsmD family RNA methyltransferase, partial [Desulfosalsimonas sp.]
LALCRAEDRAAVLCRDLLQGPDALAGPDFIFNLVFMDPPYNRGALGPALENLLKSGTLAPGAAVVIEHAPTEPVPENLPEFDVFDVRRYGKTLVTFLSYMVAIMEPACRETDETDENY